MSYKILIINPGSTSTKIGVFEDENLLFEETLRHTTEELAGFNLIVEQKDFRKKVILDILAEKNFDIKTLDVCVGRGGMLKPIPGGTYPVSDELLEDLKIGKQGQHASNLGGILAREIGDELGIPSYIVDPVVVDELMPSSRLSGVPELPRRSVFHALNQKAVAKRYAKEHGKKYEDLNLIVVHMGGGVSVGAHLNGRIVDVNNALDGEGAFSPERAGKLPSKMLVDLCYSGKYTYEEMAKNIRGKGGIVSYLNTVNAKEVEERINNGDGYAKLIYDALALQVAKAIGELSTVVNGNVDAIIITGGIAYSKYMSESISNRVKFIAPVEIMPGENELEALAFGVLRVMNGEEEATVYRETDLIKA